MGPQARRGNGRTLWVHSYITTRYSYQFIDASVRGIMDKLAVIRSMSTKPSEHFQGIDALTREIRRVPLSLALFWGP